MFIVHFFSGYSIKIKEKIIIIFKLFDSEILTKLLATKDRYLERDSTIQSNKVFKSRLVIECVWYV